MTAAPIVCRSSLAAACGGFDRDHHTRASEAGLCCMVLAFRDVANDLDDHDVSAPTSPDWPTFEPSDEDVPGGEW